MADLAPRKTARITFVGGEVVYRYPDLARSTFRRRLEEVRDQALNMAPAYQQISEYMLRSVDRNFASEGRPNRWQPLKPATIKERIRRGFGAGPILQRTGKLKDGFRTQFGSSRLSIVNGVPYFMHHQYGTSKMPARVMIVLLPQDKGQVTRIIRQHLRFE